MNSTMILQIFGLPIAAAIISLFFKRQSLWLLTAGFWVSALWLKGTNLQALDTVGMALILTLVTGELTGYVKRLWLQLGLIIPLIGLSVWQVKNFASDLSVWVWALTWLAIVAALFLPGFAKGKDSPSLSQPLSLLWLVPLAQMAPVIAMSGSLKVGQLMGTFALTGFLAWLIGLKGQLYTTRWASWLAVPAAFGALLGFHYAEAPALPLLLGFLPWLVTLHGKTMTLDARYQWPLAVVIGIIPIALGLWLVWPEPSAYGY